MASLLLDEMFSGAIADQLRAKGHDVIAVVADPALVGLSDDQILAHATDTGRALVTASNGSVAASMPSESCVMPKVKCSPIPIPTAWPILTGFTISSARSSAETMPE